VALANLRYINALNNNNNNALAHHACNPVKVQRREILSSLLLIMAFSLTAQQ